MMEPDKQGARKPKDGGGFRQRMQLTGLLPLLSRAEVLAPCSTRTRHACRCPFLAALCSAVSPSLGSMAACTSSYHIESDREKSYPSQGKEAMCTDDDATTTPTIVMIMAVAVAAAAAVVVVTAVVIHGGLFEIGQPWETKKVLVRIHQNVILMILS